MASSREKPWVKPNPVRTALIAESLRKAHFTKKELKEMEHGKPSLKLENQLAVVFSQFNTSKDASKLIIELPETQVKSVKEVDTKLPKLKRGRTIFCNDKEVRSELLDVFRCLDLDKTSFVTVPNIVAAARVIGLFELTEEFVADQVWRVETSTGEPSTIGVDFNGFCEMTLNSTKIAELVGKTFVLLSGQGRKEALHHVIIQNKKDHERRMAERQRLKREKQMSEAEGGWRSRAASIVPEFNDESLPPGIMQAGLAMMYTPMTRTTRASNPSTGGSKQQPRFLGDTNTNDTPRSALLSSGTSRRLVESSYATPRPPSQYGSKEQMQLESTRLRQNLILQITAHGGDVMNTRGAN